MPASGVKANTRTHAQRRLRWVPEMRNQTQAAAREDEQALRTVAKGLLELTGPSPAVVLEDGVNPEEVQRILDALDAEQALHRTAWKDAKAQKDHILEEKGWTEPGILNHLKSSSHNDVLHEWVTGSGGLHAGLTVEDHRILNTRDALYSTEGAFHAAQSSLGGIPMSKPLRNATVLWLSTLLMVLGIGVLGQVKRPGQPR